MGPKEQLSFFEEMNFFGLHDLVPLSHLLYYQPSVQKKRKMYLKKNLVKISWNFLVNLFLLSLILLVLIASPIILLILIYRTFLCLLMRITRPDLHGFVTGVNTQLVLFSPQRPTSNIIAALVVKGSMSLESIQKIHEKILGMTNEKNQQIYKRLTRSWENFWGYAVWKELGNFQVSNHVREYDYEGKLKLPSVCTEKDFVSVMGPLLEASWREGQSPWEVLRVGNYRKGDEPDVKTLIIFRCDHVLADGYSLLGLLRNSFECPFEIPSQSMGVKFMPKSIWEWIWSSVRMPFDVANTILLTICKINLGKRKREKDARVYISPGISVDTIKLIKRHFNVSFAAVTQFVLQGAIARALRCGGKDVPRWLSTSFILPLPDHPEGMCVHASPLAAHFACEGAPALRLKETDLVLRELVRPFQALSYVYFLCALAYLPIAVRRWVTLRGSAMGPDYIITHFPVATSKEYLDGLEVVDVIPSLSSIGSIGMTVASGGINNKQRFTFFMDPEVFGSEQVSSQIGTFMEQEIQSLLSEMA